jgi:hypothetical protein
MDQKDGSKRWIKKMDQKDGSKRWIKKMDQKDGSKRCDHLVKMIQSSNQQLGA